MSSEPIVYQTADRAYNIQRESAYGIHDYETNRKKSGGIAAICLVWAAVWIYFLSKDLAYMNSTFEGPAGKNTKGL